MNDNNPSPNETPEQDGEHSGFKPRGIVLFLFVMLLGYALYWAYLWFITVIERGVCGQSANGASSTWKSINSNDTG